MIAYRAATPADAAAISALFLRAFEATFGHLYAPDDKAAFRAQRTGDHFAPRLASPDWAFRLAEEDGVLIGYAMAGPNELPGEAPAATWELHHLYLDEPAKGRGIADALMGWVVDEARRRGFTHLQLSVYIDNHRARAFYDKRGFVEVGRYAFMVGQHVDDDRVMRLAL